MLLTSSSLALTGSSQGLRERKLSHTSEHQPNTQDPEAPTAGAQCPTTPPDHTPTAADFLHGLRLLLGEHPDAEVSVQVRLEGGRDDQVLARRQLEARADLTQVDEGF